MKPESVKAFLEQFEISLTGELITKQEYEQRRKDMCEFREIGSSNLRRINQQFKEQCENMLSERINSLIDKEIAGK